MEKEEFICFSACKHRKDLFGNDSKGIHGGIFVQSKYKKNFIQTEYQY
jgi:hypothetical protein